MIMIAKIAEAFDEQGIPQDEGRMKRFDKFAKELAWYMKVMEEGKEKHGKPS